MGWEAFCALIAAFVNCSCGILLLNHPLFGAPDLSSRNMTISKSRSTGELRYILSNKPAPETPLDAYDENAKPIQPVRATNTRFAARSKQSWMRIDANGSVNVVHLDKLHMTHEVGIQLRDLRVVDPYMSNNYPSTILIRDKGLIVAIEFVRVIITTAAIWVNNIEDVAVKPLVEAITQRLKMNDLKPLDLALGGQAFSRPAALLNDSDLPFELKMLEVCLEQVAGAMGSQYEVLERQAHQALDSLTAKVNTHNLELVRRVKSNQVRLTTKVETVREVLESLLNDDKDMRAMNLTAKEAAEVRSEQERLERHSRSFARQYPNDMSGTSNTVMEALGHQPLGSVVHPSMAIPETDTFVSPEERAQQERERQAREQQQLRIEPHTEELGNLSVQDQDLWMQLQMPPNQPPLQTPPPLMQPQPAVLPAVPQKSEIVEPNRGRDARGAHDSTANMVPQIHRTRSLSPERPSRAFHPAASMPASSVQKQGEPPLGRTSAPLPDLATWSKFRYYGGSSSSSSSSSEDSSIVEDEIAVVEMLLENYFMKFDNFWNQLQNLKEYIDDTEDLINLDLDHHRNQLIMVDLLLTAGTFSLGLVAAVTGFFGMNIGMDDWPAITDPHWIFVLTTCLTSGVAIAFFVGFILFCWWLRILYM